MVALLSKLSKGWRTRQISFAKYVDWIGASGLTDLTIHRRRCNIEESRNYLLSIRERVPVCFGVEDQSRATTLLRRILQDGLARFCIIT